MAELLTKTDKRSCYCAELSKANLGQTVCVMGWAQRQRDLGQLIFIDLRDRTGIVQLAFDDATDRAVFEKAFTVRAEFVLCAHGIVRARGEGAVNPNLPTGEIEIAVTELKILSAAQTPPFEVNDAKKVKDETALKYRYVDLRRPELQKNIKMRHEIARVAREYYYENGFFEIETPMMIKPTPEGARDYIVPSRIHNGSFYALPQSPQIYKQLLMLSGFDRYIQLARCFRDEDLRADRQPEFTQIDLEMSFATMEDIMTMNEGFIKRVFKEVLGVEIETPMCKTKSKVISGRKLAFVPILRAGLGMCDGMLALVPGARVGHIGMYRDPETHLPHEYYCKLPPDIDSREVIVLDPMLATGGSAIDAISAIKKRNPRAVKFVCIISAPEGIEALQKAHPDVQIYTAALDERLNENKYILPGLGDAGDRIFGTK